MLKTIFYSDKNNEFSIIDKFNARKSLCHQFNQLPNVKNLFPKHHDQMGTNLLIELKLTSKYLYLLSDIKYL